jgi:3-oxoacyl-[acyl-carrier protein] reductase
MADQDDRMAALAVEAGVARAFDLTGRVAVLTGGASGIGRATAHVLAGAGATVVLGDIDEAGAQGVAKEIESAGGTAAAVRIDVTDRSDVDRLVAGAMSDHGRIDVMGNIAGIPLRGLVVDMTDEELDRILAINLKGVFYGCRAAMRAMMPQRSGSIINIASGAIDGPAPTLAGYAMSKAAVAMLTKTLATEAAPYNVRVNALAPGIILSNFSRPHFVDESGDVDQEKFKAYEAWASSAAPLGRVGLPSDVAWAILYLVSDAANFVTGQIMRPNGGTAMPW